MLEPRYETARERCITVYKKKREGYKPYIPGENFGRKMNEDLGRDIKLFWKEVGKMNGRKVKRCIIIKEGNGKIGLGEDIVRITWKEHFTDLNNMNTKDQVAV